jgi:hypothetical protein
MADAGADDEPAAGAELAAAAGADDAAAAALLELVLEAAVLLLLLHAVTIRASALIPAMVAIALLADVRDTRPTSVSWGESPVRVLTTRAMKAFSTRLCKPRSMIRP